MFWRHLFIIAITIAISGSSVFGQAEFLLRGQSGITYGASYIFNKEIKGYAGHLGFATRSQLAFGLSLGSIEYKEDVYGEPLKYKALSPSITYHVKFVKESLQGGAMAFRFAYEHDDYNKRERDLWAPNSGEGYIASIGFYYNICDEREGILQPYVVMSHSWSNYRINDKEINSPSPAQKKYFHETANTVEFGIALNHPMNKTTGMIIEAALAVNDKNSLKTIGISIGFMHKIGRNADN